MAGPLEGIRVLDIAQILSGPVCATLLGDLGADVIKIEAPHKLDQTRGRAFGPYLDNDPAEDPWNRSGIFYVVNRGKRSLVLDMSKPEGKEVFLDLVRKSDIVLENYTPRVMRKWGLNYDELRKVKPSLIMLSNTGYGSTGPWCNFPSQGTTLEATMGITCYTGYAGDKPWKVGQSYPDFLACWSGLTALWSAIRHMRKTGEGQWIDVGMYQLGVALIPEPIIQKQVDGTDMPRIGNEHREHVPSNVYRAQGEDQWIALTVETDAQWTTLAQLMGQPALASDPRFAREQGRRTHREDVNALVAAWTLGQDKTRLTQILQDSGIAAGPVLNSRELLLDPHLRHRGFYERVDHPEPIGMRRIIGRPYRLRFRKVHIRKPGPRFGDGNDSVLRDIVGLDDARIAALREAGIVSDLPTNPGLSGTMDTEGMLKLRTLVAVDKDYRDIMARAERPDLVDQKGEPDAK